jgi:hypothetical protein
MATVDVDGLWQLEANRQHDTVIMEARVASGRFTNKELKEVNYCRIYLQASDITNLEGNKLEEWAIHGQRQVGRQSTWNWPIQQRPTSWKAWKMALEHLTPDGHIGEDIGDWRTQQHHIME